LLNILAAKGPAVIFCNSHFFSEAASSNAVVLTKQCKLQQRLINFQFRLAKLVAAEAYAAILSHREDKDEITGSERTSSKQ